MTDSMKEIWKDVVGAGGAYEVSNLGNIRSYWVRRGLGYGRGIESIIDRKTSPKILSRVRMKLGYLEVRLSLGKEVHKLIHRLVLESFVGPAPSGMEAAHLNGNRADNRLSNLAWVTKKENCSHRLAHRTHRQGSQSYLAKLNEEQVRVIKEERLKGMRMVDVAKRFRVSPNTINAIWKGRSWKHVS